MRGFATLSVGGLLLRGVALASKFAVAIYIGREFPTAQLGVYGLFLTTVALARFLVGFEFYNFNTRELLARERSARMSLIRDQFVLSMLFYTVSIPLLLAVFLVDVLPFDYVIYFYAILLLDYLANECARIFATLKKPVLYNLVLVLITAGWIVPTVVVWSCSAEKRFELLWQTWIAADAVAVVLSLILLKRMGLGSAAGVPVDWTWLRRGLRVSVPFFAGAVALKVIEISDRYIVDAFWTKADVGVYSLFSGITMIIYTVVFTAVILVYYPRLVELFQREEKKRFRATLRAFVALTTGTTLACAAAAVLLIEPILGITGKAVFTESIATFYILTGAVVVFTLSHVPHYILFVQHKDRSIMAANVAAAVFNIALNLALVPAHGIRGAAVATLISIAILAAIKTYFAFFKYRLTAA